MTFKNAPNKTIDVNGTPFVYREAGQKAAVPIILLHHLTAVLDDWDPKVVDGLAAEHYVVAFDSRGVGGSGGTTPATVAQMADDAVAFIKALGFTKVDLLGFSLGGFVAQVIAKEHPDLVRKLILAGTGPEGGEGIANMGPFCRMASAGPAPQANTRSTFCSFRKPKTAKRRPTLFSRV